MRLTAFRRSLATVALGLPLAACGDKTPPPARESSAGPASAPTPTPAAAFGAANGLPPPPAASNSLPLTTPTLAPAPATAPSESRMSATIGKPAPAFRLKDHTGKERSLAEFKGKRVVLWFFPKANTGGCTAEGCAFRDKGPEYVAKNAQILGISFDTPADNKSFVDKNKFDFPILSDTDKTTAIAYGAAKDATAAYPQRHTAVIGPDGTLEQLITTVAPATHAATLLETLPAAR